ncbi:MAG TPA: hypothetical protein VEV38_06100 [Candidatus Eremiobacteraceae bacterium]|nr:hypothetical protein [Candidatus Eremiobacteraceae bacterium]
MVPGHDGNMWFYGTSGQYGRITTSGVFQSRSFPDASQQGVALTLGPDSNIYIATTHAGTCHIYKVHPDLTIVDLIGSRICTNAPQSMVDAYDHRIWIVDGSSAITQVTTSGIVSTLSMPENVGRWIIRGNALGRAMFAQGISGDTPDNVYRIASDGTITSVGLAIGAPKAARDGYIYGIFGSGPYGVARLSDTLVVQWWIDKHLVDVPFTLLLHRGGVLLPLPDVKPLEGKVFRFLPVTRKFQTPWSSPSTTVFTANIGPDLELWESDGTNVYVGTLPL